MFFPRWFLVSRIFLFVLRLLKITFLKFIFYFIIVFLDFRFFSFARCLSVGSECPVSFFLLFVI
ncbi:hypothetical protein C2G38_434112 [Gigaspora rosea]|uniref:Uncharacterized protein n=1 Tax=Gigaspora rosea TaxID=44941 RepID=A0A397UJA5_9GLOM|nr:hypothetical protein C2G38_434112 [Gigaspora rosea]